MASSSSATTGVSGRSAVISGSSDSASVGGGGVMSAEGGRITVSVHTTTGGRMQLELQPQCSVASLKRTLSARLRLAKDRIVLLHRNRSVRCSLPHYSHIPPPNRGGCGGTRKKEIESPVALLEVLAFLLRCRARCALES